MSSIPSVVRVKEEEKMESLKADDSSVFSISFRQFFLQVHNGEIERWREVFYRCILRGGSVACEPCSESNIHLLLYPCYQTRGGTQLCGVEHCMSFAPCVIKHVTVCNYK